MTLEAIRALPLGAARELERRTERAYAAFVAALPKIWIYDKATNGIGFVMPWEHLNGVERDAWRCAIGTRDEGDE